MPQTIRFDDLGFCPKVYEASQDVQLRAALHIGTATGLPAVQYEIQDNGELRVYLALASGEIFEETVAAGDWWHKS